ncbi:MAG: glycosyltransferase family 4 protein [Psychroserpens sp.]|uniref:glycosyltransferase n=1 Tax=Psychroserpens sp. TaxID=2020870 RepID=UPI003C78F929
MNKKLLIIGFVWPEPKSSAAGTRMMQLIAFFKSQSYQITFASACAKSDNAVDLVALDIAPVAIELNESSFDTFVATYDPDIVLYDRFMTEEQFGWRVSQSCPNALTILDTEDLHFLRRARQKAFKQNALVSQKALYNDTAKREIASIYRCDLSLIISSAEMELLITTFKIDESVLLYLPYLIDTISEENITRLPKFENRHHFISIGNFLHEPNFDALKYLKDTLWDGIRKQLPNAQLHNYGAYASQKVNQLHNEKEGFLIKGFAEDVNEVMRNAKVLLAPIRFGAGLKGKLFDAMQNGTPFVSTSIGVEGIFDYSNVDFVSDDPESFIKHAVTLYQNSSIWTAQRHFGLEILKTRFSKSEFETLFLKRLEILRENLEEHRQTNFIGQLLQHHTLQSTKYMSKWIEAKNSK